MATDPAPRILEAGQRTVDGPAAAVLADRVTGTDLASLTLAEDADGGSGGGGGGRAARVPLPSPWPAKLDPRFQRAPTDHALSNAFAAFQSVDRFKQVPIALVDCTDPGTRLYVAQHDERHVFIASAGKVIILFAAFQLREAMRRAAATLTVEREADVFATIARGWQQTIARYYRSGKNVDNSQPVLQSIFSAARRGDNWTIDFRSAPPGGGQLEFLDHLRQSVHYSDNTGSSMCIKAMGFPWIHGVMREAGLWERGRGLWLSQDYLFHPWDADAEREGRYPPAAATARTMAALHTLLLFDELVPGSGPEMRGLMSGLTAGEPVGLGTFFGSGALMRQVLTTAHRSSLTARGKLGYLDNYENTHAEGASIERDSTVGRIRYVAVALKVHDRDVIIRLGGALDACIAVSRGEAPPV